MPGAAFPDFRINDCLDSKVYVSIYSILEQEIIVISY
jgi:hypothetical protein